MEMRIIVIVGEKGEGRETLLEEGSPGNSPNQNAEGSYSVLRLG